MKAAIVATAKSTTIVNFQTSALEGHATFFNSVHESPKNWTTRLKKPDALLVPVDALAKELTSR